VTDICDLHNRVAPEALKLIVGETMTNGGTFEDVLITLESVIVGVMLLAVKLGGDEKVIDVMIAGAKERLAEKRLASIKHGGEA
jgi:hypothetical protein